MKYTDNNEIVARKQLAISAATFLVVAGFEHVTMTITSISAEVTMFADTEEEVKDAVKKCQPFIIDGAGYTFNKGYVNRDFYYVTMTWL